ncbi:hypothetical protein N7520_002449 [Penicillium odoratum]|uniref:uncharacterized protein n=1 Tax=Penicillium odoratum TaxID=1167516 RepID=UPI002546A0E3|nr:uncharacterized protein N7520_002449 [Penicillium odoratum]KAJ5771920.1 hypothetical protein N7520_002449 [Penicillium odoratum]
MSRVEFKSKGITIVGNLYLPASNAPNRKRAAIAIGHPMGGVKEQTAGLHAKILAENGFIALTFDAAYQGESGGEPRGLEDPFQRAEDVRSAVTFLSIFPEVDPNRIGALGICASGGYVPFAAQTDVRIKAVATISAADVGDLFREGMKGTAMQFNRESLKNTLQECGQARIVEAKGESVPMRPLLPDSPEGVPDSVPTLFKEGSHYYRTPRAQHPRSINRLPVRSMDLIVNYSSFAFMDLISPRPLLMIAGTDADTLYFSEEAVARAKEPKELYKVKGKTHIQLYDDVDEHKEKLVDFFVKTLAC